MNGVRMTATYTPDNTIVTPDVEGGEWGDALGEFAGPGTEPEESYGWLGDVLNYDTGGGILFYELGPAGGSEPNFIKYVNSDSGTPMIQVTLVYDIPLTETDLLAFQTAFQNASAQASAETSLAVFDSLGSMSYQGVYVETWSDETSP